MIHGLELKTVFGPRQLFHTDSTKPCFLFFFFEWKMLVRGTVPILNVPACRVLYTEIPSNLEVGWSCPGNCPLPVMH